MITEKHYQIYGGQHNPAAEYNRQCRLTYETNKTRGQRFSDFLWDVALPVAVVAFAAGVVAVYSGWVDVIFATL